MLKLIEFWKDSYTSEREDVNSDDGDGGSLYGTVTHISAMDMTGDGDGDGDVVKVSGGFEMRESLRAMPSLRGVREVDMGYVMKVWKWVKENF